MKIIINNHNFSCAEGVTPQLRNYLSYQEKIFNQRSKRWNIKQISVIDPKGMFLTGVAFDVQQMFNATIEDQRTWPSIPLQDPELTVTCRDYQINYIIQALQAKRALIKAPTGSGKTIIMAALLSIFDCPSIILVPNKTILVQLQTELGKLIPNYEIAEARESPKKGLIGLARTLSNIPTQELQQRPLLIMDEAHGSAADQATDVILRSCAPYRYGFTATPTGRSDNKDLIVAGLFGPVIDMVHTEDLVQQGYRPNVQIELHHSNWDGNYAALEDNLIVRNEQRNAQILKIAKDFLHNRKTGALLILVRRTEHGKYLNDNLEGSVFIDGKTTTEAREHCRKQVSIGVLRALIASQVFAQGLDIPQLELGINAGGGKAEILTTQRAGRMMRPWQGLAKRWVDFVDGWHPTLDRHTKERYRIYRDSGNIKFVGVSDTKRIQLEQDALSSEMLQTPIN